MSKIIRSKRAGGMAQAVEHLPGNHHAQIQSPVASKKKKKEKEKKDMNHPFILSVYTVYAMCTLVT
jgi:hypothetical protein